MTRLKFVFVQISILAFIGQSELAFGVSCGDLFKGSDLEQSTTTYSAENREPLVMGKENDQERLFGRPVWEVTSDAKEPIYLGRIRWIFSSSRSLTVTLGTENRHIDLGGSNRKYLTTYGKFWDYFSIHRNRLPEHQKQEIYDKLFKNLRGREDGFAIYLRHLDLGTGERFKVLGTGRLVLSGGEELIEITDVRGNVHLINPRILHEFYIHVSENAELEIPGFSELYAPPVVVRHGNLEQRKALYERSNENGGFFFEDPSFFDYLRNNPEHTRRLLRRWYGNLGEDMVARLSTVNEEWVALLSDPGIAQRFNEFMTFVQSASAKATGSLVELRQSFSEHLGNKIVYRAMMLTAEQLALVQETGVLATALLNPETGPEMFSRLLNPDGIYFSPPSILAHKFDAKNPIRRDEYEFLVTSFTEVPEIALSAAYHCYQKWSRRGSGLGKRPSPHEVSLYLFELEIPKISLVENRGIFRVAETVGKTLKIGDRSWDLDHFDGWELSTFFGVSSDKIMRVERIDEIPDRFEFVLNGEVE